MLMLVFMLTFAVADVVVVVFGAVFVLLLLLLVVVVVVVLLLVLLVLTWLPLAMVQFMLRFLLMSVG